MVIGLFGGTFDPVHMGHLIVMETIRSDFGLDRVVFIPTYVPPHKTHENLSPASDRLEMTRLAVQGHESFSVSDCEIRREGISFTRDTVEWFLRSPEHREDRFVLLMGGDSHRDMNTWKNPEWILEHIRILVVRRPGFEKTREPTLFSKNVLFAQTPEIGISSSEIRERVRAGKSVRFWVPKPVEHYIQQQGLYRT